jgi:hypothetical protein
MSNRSLCAPGFVGAAGPGAAAVTLTMPSAVTRNGAVERDVPLPADST